MTKTTGVGTTETSRAVAIRKAVRQGVGGCFAPSMRREEPQCWFLEERKNRIPLLQSDRGDRKGDAR